MIPCKNNPPGLHHPQDGVYTLNQVPSSDVLSLSRVHESGNQVVETAAVSITITPSDILGELVLLIATNLGSVD